MDQILPQIDALRAEHTTLLNTQTLVKRAAVVQQITEFIRALADTSNTNVDTLREKLRFLNGGYVSIVIADAELLWDKSANVICDQCLADIQALGVAVQGVPRYDWSTSELTILISLGP